MPFNLLSENYQADVNVQFVVAKVALMPLLLRASQVIYSLLARGSVVIKALCNRTEGRGSRRDKMSRFFQFT
jgi:hypothetical protein